MAISFSGIGAGFDTGSLITQLVAAERSPTTALTQKQSDVNRQISTLGDLVIALLLAFVVAIPCRVLWRRLTRGPERWVWSWFLKVPEGKRGWGRRAVGALMSHRLPAPLFWAFP